MRKRVVVVGVILLMLAAATGGGGLYAVRSSSTQSSNVKMYAPGEYVSDEIDISQPAILTVDSPSAGGGLVPSKLLAFVNRSTLQEYAVPPNATSGSVYSYINITGSYYFVVFSNTTPKLSYLVTPLSIAAYATLIFVGLLLGFTGIAVTIAGLVLKPKRSVG